MDWLLGGAAGGLFDYNRENFFFDREQQLKREFQGQNMRVRQFQLYRDDVRDLIELTVGKMDNYLIVNAIQLGFTIVLLTEGRPESDDAPQWEHWLYSMTTISAFFYTLLSMWLAMHASIAAHSFGVRMLTQLVRLPIPNRRQLDAALAAARDYERLQVRDMFRVPVIERQFKRLSSAMGNLTAQEEDTRSEVGSETGATTLGGAGPATAALELPTTALKHMRMYRSLQANWQAYDAYARVSMAMGANQILHAISYYGLRMLISEDRSPWPALASLVLLAFCSWLLSRLDLYLSPNLLKIAGFLLLAPPAITMVGITIVHSDEPSPFSRHISDLCAPLSCLLHIGWIAFILVAAKAEDHKGVCVPMNFRSVLYLDVFGWLSEKQEPDAGAVPSDAGRRPAGGTQTDHQRTLSSVREEEAPTADNGEAPPLPSVFVRRPSTGRIQTAQNLRVKMQLQCEKLRDDFANDLARWESEDVQAMIGDDRYTQRILAELRTRYRDVVESLADAGGGKPAVQEPPASPPGRSVWLQLEWNTSGMATYYFYCCERRETVWTMPKEPDRVSSLEGMEQQLRVLDERVRDLAEMSPEPQSVEQAYGQQHHHASSTVSTAEPAGSSVSVTDPSQVMSVTDPSQLTSVLSSTVQPTSVLSSTVQPGSPRHLSPASRASAPAAAAAAPTAAASPPKSPPKGLFFAPADEGPAQETRFGGQEAVGEQLEEQFLAGAGDTFHPHRRRTRSAVARSAVYRATSRKPAGQMPWQTFKHGSVFMLCVWSVGFLWCSVRTIDERFDGPKILNISAMGPRLAPPGHLELAFAGAWPHAHFDPVAIACGSAARAPIFVAERFKVYTWQPEDPMDGPAQWQTALGDCLAAVPAFQAAGLASMVNSCMDDGKCTVYILGASGHDALACNGTSSSPGTASKIFVHGGEWRGLVSRGRRPPAALRHRDGALVWLQSRGVAAKRGGGGIEEWVPQAELLPPAPESFSHVQMLADGGMLALSKKGILKAFGPQSGLDGPPLWETRLPTGTRWAGMCVAEAERAAYLLSAAVSPPPSGRRGGGSGRGRRSLGAPVALWRVGLPSAANSAPAHE